MNCRERKFRAINLKDGTVTYDPCHITPKNYIYLNEILERLVKDDGNILQDYIGMKDNKQTEEYPEGQEIYEGDLVEHNGRKAVVERAGAMFVLRYLSKHGKGGRYLFDVYGFDYCQDIKVIGIWDDPFLKEGTK